MRHTNLRRCPEVSGGRGVGAGGERGRAVPNGASHWPEVERSASLGGEGLFNPRFSISLRVRLFACVMSVRVCPVSQVYGDHVKGWSGHGGHSSVSFFLVFLNFIFIFHLYLTRGFCPSAPWFEAPHVYGGGGVSAASPHEFGSPSIFKSATLGWRPPLSVRVMQTQPRRAGGGGFARPTKVEAYFHIYDEKGGVCVCVCVCVTNVCAVCSQSNNLPRNGS